MNFEELQGLVLDWANDKDLIHVENADKQFLKFVEEIFEFKTEMDLYSLSKQGFDFDHVMMEMGDIFVTLIILCKQLDLDPIDCLEKAYEKISKRKGKTIDGVFVKEEDL